MKLGAVGLILVLALAAAGAQTSSQSATAAGSNPAAAAVAGPAQPIPFSHKVHAGTLQLPCEFCHAMSKSGETVAIPRAPMCMQCHRTIDTSDPGVQRLATYAKSGSIIPWVRIYQLPSFVNFSHKIHLANGATCQECHGQVAERERLYKEVDISMARCMRCHEEKKASNDCSTCHSLQQ